MARIPTSGRKRSDDSDEEVKAPHDGEQYSEVAKTRLAQKLIEQAQIEKVGRLPSGEDDRRRVLRQLAILRAGRFTYGQCAEILGVSDNTIGNWLKDPLYHEEQQTFQMDARSDGFTAAGALVPKAMAILNELMSGANSDFVKLKAVELVLKTAGMEIPPLTVETDEKRGVSNYLEQIRKRAGETNINLTVTLTNQEQSQGLTDAQIVDALPAPTPGEREDMLSQLERMAILRQQQAQQSEYTEPLLPGGHLPTEEGEDDPRKKLLQRRSKSEGTE